MPKHINLKTLLGFDSKTMKLKTEILAGLTTFLTMTYILAVNPEILSSTGMDKGSLFTATALASAVGTLLMAFLSKLPFAQLPSMGINAFFAFTMVGALGYSWQTALTAVFIEGIAFILLTIFNIRERIVNSVPYNLRFAISGGIGMFIAFIGLKNAGLITSNPDTFLQLGEFNAYTILAIVSIILTGVLHFFKVKGAFFIAIIATTVIGIPFGITQIPEGFVPFSTPQSMSPTFFQFDFKSVLSLDVMVIIFSLIFMDIFNTLGTLIGAASGTELMDEKGNVKNIKQAMYADAIATSFGALCGTSTVTTCVESATGIAEGGRSGMTSLVTGILFILALFLSPVFLIIPAIATTGALVMVGTLMMESLTKIDYTDITELLPCFFTVIMIVLTYSIADGMILGMLMYVAIKVLSGRWKQVSLTLYVVSIFFLLYYIL